MSLTPIDAKLLAENIPHSEPVLAQSGSRKGIDHPEKAFRFKFSGGPKVRHISISSKPTDVGITVYINKNSAFGLEFPLSNIEGVLVTEVYSKGHIGKKGGLGMSSAAAQLSSLDPKENDALRLSVSSTSAFHRLLNWYVGHDNGPSVSESTNTSSVTHSEPKSQESNSNKADREMDSEYGSSEEDDSIKSTISDLRNAVRIEAEKTPGEHQNIPGEDVDVIVKRRVGQSHFRALLSLIYGADCHISGLAKTKLLIASHIVPWSKATGEEKTDPENGLLLAVNWDAVFDKGFICFDDQGQVIFSDELDKDSASLLGIDANVRLREDLLTPSRVSYLQRHRKEVFERWKKVA